MSTGALIFAFNNEKIDYVKIASWNAARIQKFLEIPVAVITDCQDANKLKIFDKVIYADAQAGGTRYFDDIKDTVTWNNATRVDALSLTPWENTLVVDADYIVNSATLKHIFKLPQDFLCYKNAYDICGKNDFTGMNNFGRHKFPMHWATVMWFKKSQMSEYIFDCMQMVRSNYSHYRNIYGFSETNYRNDYALSIALSLINGHTQKIDYIMGSMPTVLPEDSITLNVNEYKVDYMRDGKPKYIKFSHIDVHIMGKCYLEKIIDNDVH